MSKVLNENYHGEVYHFTSLIQASWICEEDCLESRYTSSEFSEYGEQAPTISLTRDRLYNIQSGGNNTVVRFVFDGDTLQNIRNARLRPFSYTGKKGEAEERLVNVDIDPLHKYLKRIEIDVVYDEYSWASDRDFDEESDLYNEFRERYQELDDDELSHKITDYLIDGIVNNKLFKDKVVVRNKTTECRITNVVKRVLKEYLDKNIMYPLKKTLDDAPQRYKNTDIEKLYYLEQVLGLDIIDIRHAFDKHEVFKNGWVIHFTNSPFSIIKDGFLGIEKESQMRIWRTYRRIMPRSHNEGYAFAYDVNDIPSEACAYGNYALMFRTSGLKVHNRGDEGEWQVIFNSKLANLKNCFLLKIDKAQHSYSHDNGDIDSYSKLNGASVINPSTGKVIYKSNSIDKVISWVITNGAQYKNANTFNNVSNIKSHDKWAEKMISDMLDYAKAELGDRCVIYWQSTDGFSFYNIAYAGRFKYADFVEKFGFKPTYDRYGSFINDCLKVNKYYELDYDGQCKWIEKYGEIDRNEEYSHITITYDRKYYKTD
jgi:hypothetical protein